MPFSSKRVLRSNNIDLESSKLDLTELKYLRDDFAIPDDRKVKKNSIFICMSNGSKQHVGKVAFIDTDIDYAFGGFMGLIVPKAGIAPKYVFYSCQSSAYRLFLSSIGNGIGITNLRFTDLANYSIPVPPIAEQEKIVAELDCLTGIIEKKRQQLEELDKLAQSIFYDMFGDPITNEKGWKKMLLGEICAPKKSIARASKTYKANDTIHYIDIASIDNSQALLKGTTPFVFADAPSRAQQKVEKGDVLISLVRPNLRNIAMVEYDDSLLVASSGFCVLRAKDSNLRFIKAFALTDGFTRYLTDRTAGANYPAVREEDIRACSLGVPPLDLQSEFARKVEAIDRQKELVKQSIVETETLFNSRMDFWFNN